MKNYKIHTCVRITSSTSRSTVSVIDTGSGLILVRTSLLPVKRHDQIRPVLNMSHESTSNHLVNVIGKIMDFVQLGDLHVRVHFSVVENLAVPLLMAASCIERFVSGMLPTERCIVPIRFRPVVAIPDQTAPSGQAAELQNKSDHVTDTDDQQNDNARTHLVEIAKGVGIPRSTAASLSVMSSSA